MRILHRSMVCLALAATAWAVALSTFVCDLTVRIGSCIRDTLIWAWEFFPRHPIPQRPVRRLTMAATSLFDRRVGGVRVPGFLGRPTVRMLTG